ncbi:hypothetical protein [Natronorubrum thiooxidans]|uniref:DUF8159 domain-containing protein n=1 Tax=Natronorubrum thiooxidans TaxID=308853 RepID=A0A1N7GZS5_9EURY|nr:hypothetical protein [Natronorubrum thiooxidans]SIS18117.1 hypothetical protein SAMN05421752_11920 [Natronorubrum thiooxidans]
MRRRTLLTAVASVAVAGCTSLGSGRDTPAVEESDLIEAFQVTLEDRGFEQIELEPVDNGLELGYNATGTTDDNVATELELVTDGYTTAIEGGLEMAFLNATAYDPNNDDVLDYFTIETEWVDAYLEEDLEWPELLSRIAGTFESTEPDDEDDTTEENTDGEGDSDESEGESDGDESEGESDGDESEGESDGDESEGESDSDESEGESDGEGDDE